MIVNTISCRYDTHVNYYNVRICSDPINGFSPSKECGTNLLSWKISYDLLHSQTILLCQGFSNQLLIDVLVGIHADYQSIFILSPLLQLLNQVLVKSPSRESGI